MEDRRVKGTLILDYVRMVRRNKDKDWNKYLKPEDWEIINGRILPSLWYPYETYKRAGWAAFHLIAGGNYDLVHAWGKISVDLLTKGPYKSIISDQNPLRALEGFVNLRRQFFNFAAMEFEKVGEKYAKILFAGAPDDPVMEAFNSQMTGAFEKLVELTGGKNPKVSFKATIRDGSTSTEFHIKWE